MFLVVTLIWKSGYINMKKFSLQVNIFILKISIKIKVGNEEDKYWQ